MNLVLDEVKEAMTGRSYLTLEEGETELTTIQMTKATYDTASWVL